MPLGHYMEAVLESPKGEKSPNPLEILVPQEGLEPPTPSLRMTCSTN
jgi:hypothetical protein